MFFRKKKPVPLEDVQSLQARGLGEKEIIKELKSKGYSYDEIEKAMLQTVRMGVEPSMESESVGSTEAPRFEDIYTKEEPRPAELEPGEIVLPEEPVSPEMVVEELVEGVVEEKWERLEKRLSQIEDHINTFSAQMKSKRPLPMMETSHEYDTRLNQVADQIEELQARVGGLEKAFKQFLPALTNNIDNLSKLIHEMKMKQGVEVEE